MTDHLDEAAAKAVDLAAELTTSEGLGQSVRAAQHLTYLAGLIRGGAVRERVVEAERAAYPLREVRCWAPEPDLGLGDHGGHTCDGPANHGGSHWSSCGTSWRENESWSMTEPRQYMREAVAQDVASGIFEDADPGDHDPVEVVEAVKLAGDYARERDQARAQRDELVRAARELVQTDIEPMARDREIAALREVIEQIEKG